ncbi:MAG: HK97 gp10 family phage protein [Bacillota bacterium]
MVSFKQTGEFANLTKLLSKSKDVIQKRVLEKYGKECVEALKSSTPMDSGETARSWNYHVETTTNGASIVFSNSNIQNGVPIAIILQYGHATKNGGWVQGRDYINPTLYPLFDKISKELWKEVGKL